MFVDVETLVDHGACAEQSNAFKDLFPFGIRVTHGLCMVHAHTFTWEWFAGTLLSGQEESRMYRWLVPAQKRRTKLVDTANDEFFDATQQQRQTRNDAHNALFALHREGFFDEDTLRTWCLVVNQRFDDETVDAAAVRKQAFEAAWSEYQTKIADAVGRVVEGIL